MRLSHAFALCSFAAIALGLSSCSVKVSPDGSKEVMVDTATAARAIEIIATK
jgi:hypothetical protein